MISIQVLIVVAEIYQKIMRKIMLFVDEIRARKKRLSAADSFEKISFP
jgi:hypothetical protein